MSPTVAASTPAFSSGDGSGPSSPPPRPRGVAFTALAVGGIAVVLVVILFSRQAATDRVLPSPVVGKQAPALNGQPVQGTAIDVGANDRWLVVNFFATWCAACRAEHPQLRAFNEQRERNGSARLVSVVYGDKPQTVRAYFAKMGGDWTILDADRGRTALEWGVAKVPETFLVAPSGIVVKRFTGGVTKALLDSYINAYEAQLAKGSGS